MARKKGKKKEATEQNADDGLRSAQILDLAATSRVRKAKRGHRDTDRNHQDAAPAPATTVVGTQNGEAPKDANGTTDDAGVSLHGDDPGPGSESPIKLRHHGVFSKFQQSQSTAKAKIGSSEKGHVRPGEDTFGHSQAHGLVPIPQPEETEEASGPKSTGLPDWLTKPIRVPPTNTVDFGDLGLSELTMGALKAAGYGEALPVQSVVLPMLLSGPRYLYGDLCVSAATGSGKTLAYVLPLVEDIRRTASTRLRAVIVVPTRELVSQVQSTFQLCGAGDDVCVGTASGNRAFKDEQSALVTKTVHYDPIAWKAKQNRPNEDVMDTLLEDVLDMDDVQVDLACTENFVTRYESLVDVLICTPGRLVEHLHYTKGFTLEHTRWLVIDEADRLLDQSFQEWTDYVIPAVHAEPKEDTLVQRFRRAAQVVASKRVRKIILSATMTKDVAKLAPLRLSRPQLLVVESSKFGPGKDRENVDVAGQAQESPLQYELPATLQETTIQVKRSGEKPLYIIELIQDILETSERLGATHSQANAYDARGMLVFTNSNESALRLSRLLSIMKPQLASHVKALTKSTGTSTGKRAINAFAKGKISIIIASDRASRGLDLPNLAQVVNYDMPASLKVYVHRVGRTARANKQGKAITLIGYSEARWFWNEVGKSEKILRAGKVARDETFFNRITKEMSEEYEAALVRLGEEATGGHRGPSKR